MYPIGSVPGLGPLFCVLSKRVPFHSMSHSIWDDILFGHLTRRPGEGKGLPQSPEVGVAEAGFEPGT